MLIRKSSENTTPLKKVEQIPFFEAISSDELQSLVEVLSIPRHYLSEPGANKWAAQWIQEQFESYGYHCWKQGRFDNVLASSFPKEEIFASESFFLVGAHYDSVPECPGADDNASAVAGMLICAKYIAKAFPKTPVLWIAFNREEDGLMGSYDYVESLSEEHRKKIAQVHVLEMIGYCSHEPHSQTLPTGLPISIPDQGNFLSLLGNRDSNSIVEQLLQETKSYLSDFLTLGLKIYMGVERLFPDLARSDHLPFWESRVPALMWTDTANFRNPHYHEKTDTPETLDYNFLKQVTQLLFLHTYLFCKGKEKEKEKEK